MNIAFAGFRHGHIFSIYEKAKENENVNIVACWEENEQARVGAKQRADVDFNCKSYDEILKNPAIDAVAVGDYYGIRGQRIISALKAGKHVISDKPLCTSLEELDEIERLVNETGLKVGCMLDLRYGTSTEAVAKIIRSGKIGTVHAVNFTGQHPLRYGERPSWYFEDGKHGGTINDLAIHGIDLVRYITGKELVRPVAARCWNAFADKEPQFKDSAQFMAEFEGGMGVTADVSYAVPNCKCPIYQCWRFTVWGTKGFLEFMWEDDTVSLILSGAENIEKVKGEIPKEDYLSDFMTDIDGKPVELNTQEVIKSTRATLGIQAAAE